MFQVYWPLSYKIFFLFIYKFCTLFLALNAGNPPTPNIELCGSQESSLFIPADSAAIYQNPEYPGYPNNKETKCRQTITTEIGNNLVIYLNKLQLTFSESNAEDYK